MMGGSERTELLLIGSRVNGVCLFRSCDGISEVRCSECQERGVVKSTASV